MKGTILPRMFDIKEFVFVVYWKSGRPAAIKFISRLRCILYDAKRMLTAEFMCLAHLPYGLNTVPVWVLAQASMQDFGISNRRVRLRSYEIGSRSLVSNEWLCGASFSLASCSLGNCDLEQYIVRLDEM